MLTKEVSQKYLTDALISMHTTRAASLFQTTWALMKKAHLSLTSLGRAKEGKALVKHKIKSVDRLLGNRALQKNLSVVYREFFQPFLISYSSIYIIVDWSGCCRKDIQMLRASVMHEGRSIPIYNEIHPERKVGNTKIQNRFLVELSKMIPKETKVIILSDSGFRTPWFKAVLKLGWDYIGRLNTRINIKLTNQSAWIRSKTLDQEATSKIKYIGHAQIGASSKTPVLGHIYTYKEKKKGRKEKSPYPDVNKRFSASAKNAWILATSLDAKHFTGGMIRNRYRKRMQIEQNFRDDKSARFGFGWRIGRSKKKERIAVLCLIASIATFFLWALGVLAEKLGLHRQFQVNTIRNKRVLSHVFLGKQLLYHAPPNMLVGVFGEAMELLFTNQKNASLC